MLHVGLLDRNEPSIGVISGSSGNGGGCRGSRDDQQEERREKVDGNMDKVGTMELSVTVNTIEKLELREMVEDIEQMKPMKAFVKAEEGSYKSCSGYLNFIDLSCQEAYQKRLSNNDRGWDRPSQS